MASVWDTIKTRGTQPTDVANPDAEVTIDPARGAPIRVRKDESLKFRPAEGFGAVIRELASAIDAGHTPPVRQRTEYPPADKFKETYGVTFEEAVAQSNQRIAEASAFAEEQHAEELAAHIDLEDPNADLVSDDVETITTIINNPAPDPVQPKQCNDGRSKYARTLKKLSAMREDVENAEALKAGRPRKYKTNAQRQDAYRLRKKAKQDRIVARAVAKALAAAGVEPK
jgi:hypothetical protein